MASPFDRLMDSIRPSLPGAIDTAIKQELFLVCKDFFDWSDAWQEEIEFEVQPNSREGELLPYVGRIQRLMGVTQDGFPIRGAHLGQVDMSNAVPIYLRHPDTRGSTYYATVSLTVSDPVGRDALPIVPVQLVFKYTDSFIHGILSRMMSQPSKPYTNLSLAQFHLAKFRGGASRAKNEIKTGSTQSSQAWTFPKGFIRRK